MKDDTATTEIAVNPFSEETWELFATERVAGVYVLLRNGSAQYIGQSLDVNGRVIAHRAAGRIEFDSVRIIRVPDALERLALEKKLIQVHQPPCNYVHTDRAKIPTPSPNLFGEGKMIRTSICMPESLKEKLDELAARSERSANNFMCCLISNRWERMKREDFWQDMEGKPHREISHKSIR